MSGTARALLAEQIDKTLADNGVPPVPGVVEELVAGVGNWLEVVAGDEEVKADTGRMRVRGTKRGSLRAFWSEVTLCGLAYMVKERRA